MSDDKSYWVVEYRLPIVVPEAATPEEAANIAKEQVKKEYNTSVSHWFVRVFEYGAHLTEVGPLNEYFANPSGSKFRKLDQNDEEHGRKYHEVTEEKLENE
jgi:hypothetical protein